MCVCVCVRNLQQQYEMGGCALLVFVFVRSNGYYRRKEKGTFVLCVLVLVLVCGECIQTVYVSVLNILIEQIIHYTRTEN